MAGTSVVCGSRLEHGRDDDRRSARTSRAKRRRRLEVDGAEGRRAAPDAAGRTARAGPAATAAGCAKLAAAADDAQTNDSARPAKPAAPADDSLAEPKNEPSASEVLDTLRPRDGAMQPIVRPNMPGAARPTTPGARSHSAKRRRPGQHPTPAGWLSHRRPPRPTPAPGRLLDSRLRKPQHQRSRSAASPAAQPFARRHGDRIRRWNPAGRLPRQRRDHGISRRELPDDPENAHPAEHGKPAVSRRPEPGR